MFIVGKMQSTTDEEPKVYSFWGPFKPYMVQYAFQHICKLGIPMLTYSISRKKPTLKERK